MEGRSGVPVKKGLSNKRKTEILNVRKVGEVVDVVQQKDLSGNSIGNAEIKDDGVNQTVPVQREFESSIRNTRPHSKVSLDRQFDIVNTENAAVKLPQNDSSCQMGEADSDDRDDVTICHMESVSKYKVKINVGGVDVEAVVDTAAEVTIISEEVFHCMKVKPKYVRTARLRTAGLNEPVIIGKVIGPVKLKIGSRVFNETIHVAPIGQSMLFGFDLLYRRSVINMETDTLRFDGEIIHMNVDEGKRTPTVARVEVCKRRVIPPNSVVQVNCKINREMPQFVIEADTDLKVLIPKTVHSEGKTAVLCVVNATDKYRLFKKGKQVANAYPVDEVILEGNDIQDDELEEMNDAELYSVDAQSVERWLTVRGVVSSIPGRGVFFVMI